MIQWSDMWLFRQPFGTKFSTEGNFREFYARTLRTRKLRALLKIGETNTNKAKFVLFILITKFQFNYTEQHNDLSF